MKAIEASGRRRHEIRSEEIPAEVAEMFDERTGKIDTAGFMEQTWMANMPRAAVNAIERGNIHALEQSVSGNSAFGDVAGGTTRGPMGPSRVAGVGRGGLLTEDNSITNREELLMSLYDVHDDLISAFEKVPDSDTVTLDEISGSINKIGNCIIDLGGKIEKFSAIDHVSGLAAPSLDNGAEKVIETTKKLYTRANIDQAFEQDKSIVIVFSGEENGVLYRTAGKITPKYCWNGNEALDYVYTPRAGKMSVKIFENGKWSDKSDNYEITWNVPSELNIARASADQVEMFRKGGQKQAQETPVEPQIPTTEAQPSSEEIPTNFEISEKSTS
jgi:hypothetical protein